MSEVLSLTQEEYFIQLQKFAEQVPVNMYWVSLDYKVVGVNQNTLHSIGAKHEDVVSKTLFEMYPKHIAEDLVSHVQEVIRTRTAIKREHAIEDMATKYIRYYYDVMSPIFDNSNRIIGVIGASIEITSEKEKERLKIQNAVYEAEIKSQKIFRECMDDIQHLMHSAKIKAINNKMGLPGEIKYNEKRVVLTRREKDILYYLSMGKTLKDIASVLSIIESKDISYNAIGTFITRQLYPKFEVYNVNQLVEKANALNLIPFLDEHLL